jgi:hypothetical protein
MQQQAPNLVSLSVLRSIQHGKTRRMDTRVVWLGLGLFLLLAALLVRRVLLLLALALLCLELRTLFAVARALVGQLVVLGDNFGLAGFAVAAAASTVW